MKAKIPGGWRQNALRHSFISYRVAVTGDVARTSLEAGNSPKMIFRHYREIVDEEAAKAWFAITPPDGWMPTELQWSVRERLENSSPLKKRRVVDSTNQCVTMKATILTHNVRTMNTCESMIGLGSAEIIQPTLIKKKELAKRLSVSTRTIDNWVAKRLIPYIQVTPRFYLYEFEAVLDAIKKHYRSSRSHGPDSFENKSPRTVRAIRGLFVG